MALQTMKKRKYNRNKFCLVTFIYVVGYLMPNHVSIQGHTTTPHIYIYIYIYIYIQAAIVSILLYGCTTWTLTKRMEKIFDGNYTRMLRVILNKPWRQHPTKQQLYIHQPSITRTIKSRLSRRVGHCWRSRDELISDVLLWTPSHGRAKAGRPARTYKQQLCADTGCSPEDLPKAMIGRHVEGRSGISVLIVQHDDDDDDDDI